MFSYWIVWQQQREILCIAAAAAADLITTVALRPVSLLFPQITMTAPDWKSVKLPWNKTFLWHLTVIMAEALDNCDKERDKGGEVKMREENRDEGEKVSEEMRMCKEREQELTGRQDGWFVIRREVSRKGGVVRKSHAMSLQGAIKVKVNKRTSKHVCGSAWPCWSWQSHQS